MINCENVQRIKCVVVGDDEQCGIKSSLLRMLIKEFAPNLEDMGTVFYSDDFENSFQGKRYTLNFCDTTGQEEYDRLRILSYSNASVLLLVFSLDDEQSFEHLKETWFPEGRSFCREIPFVMVGIKNEGKKIDVDVKRIMSLMQDVKKNVRDLRYVECDLNDDEQVNALLEAVIQSAGQPKCLNANNGFFDKFKTFFMFGNQSDKVLQSEFQISEPFNFRKITPSL